MQQQKLAAYRQQEMLQALGQGASVAGVAGVGCDHPNL